MGLIDRFCRKTSRSSQRARGLAVLMVLFAAQTIWAEEPPTCKGEPQTQLTVSGYWLREFAKLGEDRSRFSVIVPPARCWADSLRIVDDFGVEVGRLTVTQRRTVRADMTRLPPKNIDSVVVDWLDVVQKRHLSVPALLRFFFVFAGESADMDPKSKVQLLQGQLAVNLSYVLAWNTQLDERAPLPVKTISYDELISLLRQKKADVLDGQSGEDRPERWKLPGSEVLPSSEPGRDAGVWSLGRLLSMSYSSAGLTAEKTGGTSKTLILHGPPSFVFNYLTRAKLQGHEAPLWFKGGVDEWNRNTPKVVDVLAGETVVTSEQLVRRYRSEDTVLIDLRTDRLFQSGHIPGAISADVRTFSTDEFKPPPDSTVGPNDWIFTMNDELQTIKKENAIVYTTNSRSWDAQMIRALRAYLRSSRVKKIEFYREGWVDWIRKVEWQGKPAGYEISLPAPSPNQR